MISSKSPGALAGVLRERATWWVAPEHVSRTRLESNAGLWPTKRSKIAEKPPDWGYAHWDKQSFERLVASEPEPLVSRFEVSHGMLLGVLGRPHGGCRAMKQLVKDSFETPVQKRKHRRTAFQLLRSLWQAGVLDLRHLDDGGGIRLNDELQADFSLFHALGLYVVDAVERLERESPSYALDLLTLVESVLEDPEIVLQKQVDRLKTQKIGELKAAGVEYEQRMEELEKVEHPKPNLEFLNASFALFSADHPWVKREALRPKSIAREIIENIHSFSGYIKEYGLARSEGVLLRYLSDVYKTLVPTVPAGARTEQVTEAIATLGALVRGVDSSLIDEWERMQNPDYRPDQPEAEDERPTAYDLTRDTRVFTALIRNLLFSFLRALENGDYETASDLVEPGVAPITPTDLERAIRPLFDDGQHIQLDGVARNPAHLTLERNETAWTATQNILVEDEVSEYLVRGRIDLERSRLEKRPVFLLDQLGSSAP